jgi:hypothetical protein
MHAQGFRLQEKAFVRVAPHRLHREGAGGIIGTFEE